MPSNTAKPATESQLRFLHALARKLGSTKEQKKELLREYAPDGQLTASRASAMIADLKNQLYGDNQQKAR